MLAVVCLLGVASAKNVSPLRPSSSPGRSLRGRVLWSARTDTAIDSSCCHSLQPHIGDEWCMTNCPDMIASYPEVCAAKSSSSCTDTTDSPTAPPSPPPAPAPAPAPATPTASPTNSPPLPTPEALAKQKAEQELQAAHQKEAAELHAAELAKKEADDLEAKKDAEELKRAEEAQQKAAIAAGVAKEKAEAAAEAAEEQRLADEKSLAEEKRAQLVALKAKKEAADAARVAAEAAEKAKAAADKKSAFDATSSYHTDYHYNEWYKAQYTAIDSVSNYCKTHPTWGNLLHADVCGIARTRANNAWTSYVNNIALRKIRITSYCAKYEPDNASGCEARL